MSVNGDSADLVMRESIQITEDALKLVGLGAKNLAALLLAVANDNQKVAGKTILKRLLRDGEPLTVFSIKRDDLDAFRKEAKKYGLLFSTVRNKVEDTGTIEIIAKVKDARQINYIFEKLGYPAPVREEQAKENAVGKKDYTRDPSGKSLNTSKERGAATTSQKTTTTTTEKPSVKAKLKGLKAQADVINQSIREAKEKAKEAPSRNSPEL